MAARLLQVSTDFVFNGQQGSPYRPEQAGNPLGGPGGGLPAVLQWSDAGAASWYDVAIAVGELAQELGLLEQPAVVNPLTTAEYPLQAQRPSYSLLDCSATRQALDLPAVHWRQALRKLLEAAARPQPRYNSATSGLLSRFISRWSVRRLMGEGSSWKASRPRSSRFRSASSRATRFLSRSALCLSLAYGQLRLQLLDFALELFQPHLSGGIAPPVEHPQKRAEGRER
jgi:hypothetical protein